VRFRAYLEAETRAIREGLRDAESWLARIELDAALTHEVEAAVELVAVWRRSWDTHCELCDLLAAFARRVLASEVSAFGLLAGQTV
jgi:hypothetical protein